MKLIFFVGSDIDNDVSIGIRKKIFGQIEALKSFNYKVDLCYIKEEKSIIIESIDKNRKIYKENLKDFGKGSNVNKIKLSIANYINGSDYDIVYIRSGILNYYAPFFLGKIKRKSRLIFLEIPTYPYTYETLSKTAGMEFTAKLRMFRRILVDFFIRRLIRFYVDYIVLTIPKTSLWGIPVISIENSICIEKISLRNQPDHFAQINLFTATNIEIWQGLERVIKGLQEYEKQKNDYDIYVKIAGEGTQKKALSDLVQKCHLEHKIMFTGPAQREKLNELFNEADIGIGSLGRHRQKTNVCSTLKVKEYCAKGIPFIYSNDEPSLTGDEPFALKLMADESPVDFRQVIAFFQSFRKNPGIEFKMKKFAEENYDWSIQMKKIHQKILEDRCEV